MAGNKRLVHSLSWKIRPDSRARKMNVQSQSYVKTWQVPYPLLKAFCLLVSGCGNGHKPSEAEITLDSFRECNLPWPIFYKMPPHIPTRRGELEGSATPTVLSL